MSTTTAPLTCGICETPATHREFYAVDAHWDLCRNHAKDARTEPNAEVIAHSTLLREEDEADHRAERAGTKLQIEESWGELADAMGWDRDTGIRHLERRYAKAVAKAIAAGERAEGVTR